MTIQHKIEIDSIVFLGLAAAVGVLLALYANHPSPKVQKSSFTLPVIENFQISPTPVVANPTTVSQPSPDGRSLLSMTITPHTSNTSYKLSVADQTGTTQQTIYTTTLPDSENLSIPFNTFSPDNKYFFVQKNSSSHSAALVFRADGSPIAENTQFYNAYDIFTNRGTGNTYDITTGWASETLLIINTKIQSGDKGPSYWLEVPSKAVIQLSTEF